MAAIVDVTGEGREEAIADAADALRAGELVVLPTDTVYGIAADAFSTIGTASIFAAKKRQRSVPLPIMVRGPKQLIGITRQVPVAAERLMAAYWPGELTIVIASEPNLRWDLGDDQGTVAVRMPLDDVTLAVIRAVGPLALTSANISGQPPATTVEEAQEQFGDAVRYYLDDGPRASSLPSTIVDLTRSSPHILRTGSLDAAEVLAVARGEHDPFDGASRNGAEPGRDEPGRDEPGQGPPGDGSPA